MVVWNNNYIIDTSLLQNIITIFLADVASTPDERIVLLTSSYNEPYQHSLMFVVLLSWVCIHTGQAKKFAWHGGNRTRDLWDTGDLWDTKKVTLF